MPDSISADSDARFLAAITSLSSRMGQVEATLESFSNTLRDLRSDQRASGVNWLGILALIVTIVVPIGAVLGAFIFLSGEPSMQLLSLHEKRLDRYNDIILVRAERLARLEAHSEEQKRASERSWTSSRLEADSIAADKDELERQSDRELRQLIREVKEDANERLGRLETVIGQLRVAIPNSLPIRDQ